MSAFVSRGNANGVRRSAERVNAALHDVVNRLPLASGRTPKDLARRLKVHRTIASRLLGALRMSDPLAVVANIPGRQGLGSILQAAEPLVGSEPVSEARKALDEFDHLVEHGLGGREVLDVALGAWLPETRSKHELACKQQIFRGLCGLAGAAADVTIETTIRYPNEDGVHANVVEIYGLIGLRRLCPGKAIPIGVLGLVSGVSTASGAVVYNLPDCANPDGPPLLEKFCSTPVPPMREIRMGNSRQYLMPGDEIGNSSKLNIITGVIVNKIGPLFREDHDPPRRTGGAHLVELPTKTLLMDRLVLDDGSQLRDPQVFMHRTGMRGAVDPNDPMRELDRMECTETIQFLGRGAERFGALEVASYPEVIRHVCAQLGLDSSRLVGHRCRVQYPLPHVQYSMGYMLPSRTEYEQARAGERAASVTN